MSFQVSNTSTIVGALGQFVTKKVSYNSTAMLAGRVLKLSIATFYDNSSPPSIPGFQILYPASPGLYDFTNLGSKNYRATLKVINSQQFEIHFSFFLTKGFNGWNNCINSQALNLSANQIYNLGLYLKSDSGDLLTLIPVSINAGCNDVAFIEDGFIPNTDLPIQIEIQGSVNNNFYCGFIRSDNISDSNSIIPGLFKSYVNVGAGIIEIDDFDSSCLVDGIGFNEVDGVSTASVTIPSECIFANATYQLLVIYYKNGAWQSCLSQQINQSATNVPIEITGTYLITDASGNTGENCVNGLSNSLPIDLRFDVDIAAYENSLDELGLTGTFTDYFVKAKVFYSTSPNTVGGFAIPFTNETDGIFLIPDFKYSGIGTVFVIIQLEMKYLDHTDFINLPFQLNFDAEIVNEVVLVTDSEGNLVDEICDDETYTIVNEFDGCYLLQSINGSSYVEVESIDIESIPINSIACYEAVCIGEGSSNPCDCESICGEMEFYISANHANLDAPELLVGAVPAGVTGFIEIGYYKLNNTSTIPFIESSFEGNEVLEILTADVWRTIVTYIKFNHYDTGCIYEWRGSAVATYRNGDTETDIVIPDRVFLKAIDCDCEEVIDINNCSNKAAIEYTCDEETSEVTLNVVKFFDSPLESESFKMTFDGVTWFDAASTVTGQDSIFVTYDAIFSDGCLPVHCEQNIQCREIFEMSNQREIELENVGNLLEITFTDSFESTILSDILRVSLDNGLTFTEFNMLVEGYTPMALIGNEQIVVDNNVIFNDGSLDVFNIKTLNLKEIGLPCESDYDDYSITATFNEETGLFTIVKTGNETVLSTNDLRWTIEGGNPHDNNNSGVIYSVPVEGQGMFVASWKIKLPNCETVFKTAVAFGTKCMNFCDPIEVSVGPVTVTMPEVLKVCIVECDCPGVDLEIVCIDHVLTVSGFVPGSTITWTGPGGFTATGNDVTIEDEGTYFVEVIDTSGDSPCTSTASYLHTEPDAGETINPIIIVS